jgi:hypothetical protein
MTQMITALKFRDLPIGATFDFVPPDHVPGSVSFFDRCQKTSARIYQSLRLPKATPYLIGTINVAVHHVDNGNGHIFTADEIAEMLTNG